MPKKPSRSLELTDDRMCFGCGTGNSRGLKLRFEWDSAAGRIRTRWVPSKEFQGYAGIVHGGILALIFDELLGNLLWGLKKPSVTAEFTVQFRRPARVGVPIQFEGRIGSESAGPGRPSFQMEGSAKDPSGRVLAEASGRFVQMGRH